MCGQQGGITYEVVVTYHSYVNPTRRCVDCGGGAQPGCCEVLVPVPQSQTCPTEDTCDTALTHCIRSLGSNTNCTEAEDRATLAPTARLNVRSTITFGADFFGLQNPVIYNSTQPYQVSSLIHFMSIDS